MQSFPKDPEALSCIVLEPVIIPCQCARVFPPPFRGDAFWSFGHDDGVPDPAPDKLRWRCIRDFKGRVDPLGWLKQPDWPLGRTSRMMLRSPFRRYVQFCLGCRFKRNSAFGNVRVDRNRAKDAAIAKPDGKPVDKCVDFFCFLRPVVEAFLDGLTSLDTDCGKPEDVKTVAGIERITECGKPLFQQSVQGFCLGHRPPGLNADTAHIAVGAEETRFDLTRAFHPLLQVAEELVAQGKKDVLNGFHGDERFRHAPLYHANRDKAAWGDWLAGPSEQCIQPIDQLGSEASSESCTWQDFHIADAAQAGAFESGKMAFLDIEAVKRQGAYSSLLIVLADDPAWRMTGKGVCCSSFGGNSAADDHTMLVKPLVNVLYQGSFVAKKMDTAGHVEDEAMRHIKRDKGGIAIAPVGELFQKRGILARRGESDIQFFKLRTRIGQGHALVKTSLGGLFVDSRQPQGIGKLVHHDQVLISMAAPRIFAFEAVGRQVGKPQCQKSVRSV
jgi:hypothetical protein